MLCTNHHAIRRFVPLALAVAVCSTAGLHAKSRAGAQGRASALQQFLARGEEPTVEYRAIRRLEAHNVKFGASGWMTAWTEFDRAKGFRFQVMSEGGSNYVRSHVLRLALEGEQKMWADREPQRASLTTENYTFEEGGLAAEGLTALGIKPRRKDVLLIDGAIFVHPDSGDLTRIEGRLSKAPSLWTRRVEIIRRYERIGGVRVPVSIESTAQVLIAGRSTFKMTYEYETINGQRVGDPQPPAASAATALASH
jgi:hypothetical protein